MPEVNPAGEWSCMVRLIKKWMFVRRLNAECSKNAANESAETMLNARIKIKKSAFIQLVSAESETRHLFRNAKAMSSRIDENNSLLESCMSEGLVISDESGHFIRTSHKGDDFCGCMPLLQRLLSEYRLAWTIVLIPLLIGVLGSQYVKKLWEVLFK